MFKFPVKVHKTVRHKQLGVSDSPIDMKALLEKDKRDAAMKQAALEGAQFREEMKQRDKKHAMENAMFYNQGLQRQKLIYIDKISKTVPDALLSEAFGSLYMDVCRGIHDPEFVAENSKAFKDMARMYIRKLGGMDYLKSRLANEATYTSFLKDMYTVCDEAAKKIVKKKTEDIMKSVNEEEAKRLLNNMVTDKDKEELVTKIDSLGADQLAELIRNKVVAVVRDEQIRERDEREMRTILKNDLTSKDGMPPTPGATDDEDEAAKDDLEDVDEAKKGKKSKSKKKDKEDANLDTDATDTKDDDMGDEDLGGEEDEGKAKKSDKSGKKGKKDKSEDEESEPAEDTSKAKADTDKVEDEEEEEPSEDEGEKDKEDKKGKKKKAAKESLEEVLSRWDPVKENFTYSPNRQPKSLLFAMNVAIARDMLTSAHVTEGASITKQNEKKIPQAVLENPLNMDVFSIYLKDNQDGYKDIDDAMTSEPSVLGSTEPIIDPDSVMTEALVQYALLETAASIKLISPTKKQVMEQVQYLLRI
jgi:hypothetical protein